MALIKAVIPFATDTTKILGAKVFLDKYLSGFLVWRENDRILYFALIFITKYFKDKQVNRQTFKMKILHDWLILYKTHFNFAALTL